MRPTPSVDSGKARKIRLENVWLDEHAQWEAEANWSRLLDWYGHLVEPAPRWQAAALRAYAFLGDEDRFASLDRILSRDGLMRDSESQAVCDLARSARARRAERWKEAKNFALRAVVSARRGRNFWLRADAEFALGLCLAEEGRYHRAVDLFQTIAHNPKASSFRRGLAAANEAWLLWDLGRPEGLRQVVQRVPDVYRPRIEIMLAVNDLDEAQLLEFVGGAQAPDLPTVELTSIAILILEWLFLSPASLAALRPGSWFRSFAATSDHKLVRQGWQALEQRTPLSAHLNFENWRCRLDFQFLRALSWLDRRPEKAMEIYRLEIDGLLAESGIETTLIPSTAALGLRTSPWCRRLQGRLRASPELGALQVLQVVGDRVHIFSEGQRTEIPFRNSPMTIRVLKHLAGPRGRQISKRYLHECLTGTRYAPHLHDDRLHKLLRRLELKIKKIVDVRIWAWPKNHHLELLVPIEVTHE